MFDGPPCAVCGGSKRLRIARLPHTTVYQCLRCYLAVCDPLPAIASESTGDVSILTEESYTRRIVELKPAAIERYRLLARARHDRYRASVGRDRYRLLEIGCGAAGLADELTRAGVSYRGIDLDPRPVAAARARGVADVEVADFMRLPVPAQGYDVICSSQVLEHITTPVAFVERIRAWLAPRGVLHLDLPNHLSLAGILSAAVRRPRDRFGGIEFPHHSFAYQRRTLRVLLSERFDARVFTAAPDDLPWGQAATPGAASRAYYVAQRLVGLKSMLVAYGTRR